MTDLHVETLTNIIIEHEHGGAIYMSKATTEEDLRMAGISLVERCPTLLRVITLFIYILHRMILRAYLTCLP